MSDDLSIDVSKWFKKAPEQAPPASEGQPATGGDTRIDVKKVGSWLLQHKMLLLTLVLCIIPIWVGMNVRVQPVNVPLADDYAVNQVHGFIRNDIQNAFAAQYPNLPEQNRNKLVSTEFAKVLSQPTYSVKTGSLAGQTFNIQQQISSMAEDFRGFFQYEANGRKFTYMPDIDPYTYLRWARNYLEKGDIADERREGIAYDNHMVAPLGATIDTTLHPYVLAWTYRVLSVFSGSITLMQAASYFPVIFIALSCIPAFFIGRKIGGNTAGFFATLVFVLNGALLARTNWGHADTDTYNVFFPLVILWLFLEAYDRKSWLTRLGLMALAGLATGLFAFSWSGWWYIFDFLLLVSGAYLVYLAWSHRSKWKNLKALFATDDIKHHVSIMLLFVILSGVFVTAFIDFGTFSQAPFAPFDFVSIKNAAKTSLFPNVLTTVAELNSASLSQVIDQMGGRAVAGVSGFFFIAVIGLLLLALPREQFSKRDLLYFVLALVFYTFLLTNVNALQPLTFLVLFAIPLGLLLVREALRPACAFDLKLPLFLLIWFLATMYASTKGVRFVMLLVPAFSIAFGAGASLLCAKISSWSQRVLKIKALPVFGLLALTFLLLFITPYQNAVAASRNDLPIVNDGWYATLTSIRDASQPTAIITSWWDFGHHFKYVSDRRVTFDGASQNEPMAHWVGKILLTDDELLARGLLRMLDCGSNKAFDTLDAEVHDASVTVDYIYDTVKLSKDQAATYLKSKGISDATRAEYLKYTHCDAPEAFFIASGDMIGKSGVWAHFGSWDFNRADIWVYAAKMPHDEAVEFIVKNSNVTRDQAEQWYAEVSQIANEADANSWIAPWPSYNADLFGCSQKDAMLDCGNAQVNLSTMEATIGAGDTLTNPAVFVYPTPEGLVKKEYPTQNEFGLTLVPTGDEYALLLASKQLSASMFTRMYYWRGHGLQYFKQFTAQQDVGSSLIFTYTVDWDGGNKTVNPAMKLPVIV